MVTRIDVSLADGRALTAYDTGGTADQPTLVWHHGSPQTGAPLPPLLTATAERGIRLVSYARPSYGGSSPRPGRDVASAARDVEAVADALGLGRFAVAGASGGGPHALACAALLPQRVTAAITFAGIAPYSEDFPWYEGMTSPGGLQAAAQGRAARAHYAESDEFDPTCFVAADWAALDGSWASLGEDATKAGAAGPDGLVDDDVAFATPWGFDPAAIDLPSLILQGGLDRVVPASHGEWLAAQIPAAELWLRPEDGHVSILLGFPLALDWLLALPESRSRR